eukprot:g27936.t1
MSITCGIFEAALEPPPRPKPGAAPQKASASQRATASAELSKVLQDLGATDLGALQHTCKPKPLTESEVNLTGLEPNWTELGASAVTRLEYGQNGSAHVLLRKNAGQDTGGVVPGSFAAALRFIVKEEGDDLGYEEPTSWFSGTTGGHQWHGDPASEVISTGDYIFARSLQQGQFRLESGVEWIIATLNMHPCDNTGKVEPGGRGHTALLSGTFLGGQTCLVKALVGMDAERGCVARISARAKSGDVCQAVVNALM